MPWLYLNQETWNTFNTCNRKGEIQQFQGYEVTDIYLCRESLLITGVIFVNKYLENTRVKSNKILIQDLLTYISFSNVLLQTCWSCATTAKIGIWEVFDNFFPRQKLERECFIEISKYRKESWKYDAQWIQVIFDDIRGVWITDEKHSPVFDKSSQAKQKLRSTRRSEIIQIYTHTFTVVLTFG